MPCFNGDIPPPPTPPALNPPNGRPVDDVVDFLLFDPPVPNMFAPKLLALLPVADVELTDVVPAAGDELLLPPKLNPPDLLSVLLGGANGFIFEEMLVLKPALENGRDGAPPSFFDVDVVFDEPNNPPPPALLLLALDPAVAEGAPDEDDGNDDAKDEPNISNE